MTDTDRPLPVDDDVPLPLIEVGDWVRLTRPHRVPPEIPGLSTTEYGHGIVVEVIDRFGFRESQRGQQLAERLDKPPVKRVSCHLWNAEHKTLYARGHPTQEAKPEYVDHHISSLSLIHKAGDPWGNEYDIEAAPVYTDLGFRVPDPQE